MSAEVAFTKGNLEDYLRMLAKEFRKRNGKVMPADYKNSPTKIMLDERNDIWYYKRVEESRVSTLTLAQSSD